jgi:hypothetical protein
MSLDRMYGFYIPKLPMKLTTTRIRETVYSLSEVVSWNKWHDSERILKIPLGLSGTAGVIWYKSSPDAGYSVLRLGFDFMFNPACRVEGPLWSRWGTTTRCSSDSQETLKVRMDGKWIDDHIEPVFRGDRLAGLNGSDGLVAISIFEKGFQNQRMWVVEIKHMNTHNLIVYCEGCNCCEQSSLRSLP